MAGHNVITLDNLSTGYQDAVLYRRTKTKTKTRIRTRIRMRMRMRMRMSVVSWVQKVKNLSIESQVEKYLQLEL